MNNQITYADKVALNQNSSVPDINKVNADDMNEIKAKHNGVMNGSIPMGNIIVDSIKSKNMLDFRSFSTQTINDITFTNNGDGSITINGTASQAFGVNFIQFKINAGNYYLSLNATSTPPSQFYLYDHDSYVGYGNGAITLPQDFTHMGFDTYIQNGDTFNNITIRPQLEIGTTATSFAPFQELDIKDSGWQDLTLINGVTARSQEPSFKPQFRSIGNIVYLKGQVNIPSHSGDLVMANLPSGFIPSYETKMPSLDVGNWIDTSGNIIVQESGNLQYQSINTSWLNN